MDKVAIRQARPEDRDAVLKINDNVFDGRDYLPAYYDHFCKSPDIEAPVLLYDGKIVCHNSLSSQQYCKTVIGSSFTEEKRYVWSALFLLNDFAALKGTHFYSLICSITFVNILLNDYYHFALDMEHLYRFRFEV